MRPWSLSSWVWGSRVALPDTLVLGRFPSPVRQGEIALELRGLIQTDAGGIKGGWRPL
jgi:hypothetical protein